MSKVRERLSEISYFGKLVRPKEAVVPFSDYQRQVFALRRQVDPALTERVWGEEFVDTLRRAEELGHGNFGYLLRCDLDDHFFPVFRQWQRNSFYRHAGRFVSTIGVTDRNGRMESVVLFYNGDKSIDWREFGEYSRLNRHTKMFG